MLFMHQRQIFILYLFLFINDQYVFDPFFLSLSITKYLSHILILQLS
jgi:hypothetical protein